MLIPQVQNWAVEYLNNRFHATNVYLEASTISFEMDDGTAKINDSAEGFTDAGFVDGIDIDVNYSLSNDGIYTVATVADGVLILASGEEVTTEDAAAYVKISMVKFPKGIQLWIAKLIGYNLDTKQMQGIQSESLADYSVSYSQVAGSAGSYPAGLLSEGASWKKIYR